MWAGDVLRLCETRHSPKEVCMIGLNATMARHSSMEQSQEHSATKQTSPFVAGLAG